MIPTLLVGDFILVNKFSYGVRLPVTGTLLVPVGEPARGDVVVFRFPDDPSQDFIKRVIGLPGDRVEIKDDRVVINGQPLDRVDEGESSYFDVERARDVPIRLYREFDGNGDGNSHPVIHQPGRLGIHRRGPWKVPEGQYFMMGDNRDASSDSRAWRVSFVRADQLKGRAMVIHWSWIVTAGERRPDNPIVSLFDTLWRLVTFQIEEVRWSRIGSSVR
jgi:signal peptidase I